MLLRDIPTAMIWLGWNQVLLGAENQFHGVTLRRNIGVSLSGTWFRRSTPGARPTASDIRLGIQ